MPNQFTRHWSKSENEFLIQNFKCMSYAEIGVKIDRSYASVQSKIRKIKINKRINKILIDYHGTIMCKKNKNAYTLHYGQKASEKIFQYMYNNATIFMLRKH